MSSSNPLSYLRKESLDIFNRLLSIEEDISFVRQVNQAYPGVLIIRAQSYVVARNLHSVDTNS